MLECDLIFINLGVLFFSFWVSPLFWGIPFWLPSCTLAPYLFRLTKIPHTLILLAVFKLNIIWPSFSQCCTCGLSFQLCVSSTRLLPDLTVWSTRRICYKKQEPLTIRCNFLNEQSLIRNDLLNLFHSIVLFLYISVVTYIVNPGDVLNELGIGLTTHTSLSSIQRGYEPGFVNYNKGALDSQPQVR
jgi:hypothetical protein